MSEQQKPWVVECEFHHLHEERKEKYKAEQILSRDRAKAHPTGKEPKMRQ